MVLFQRVPMETRLQDPLLESSQMFGAPEGPFDVHPGRQTADGGQLQAVRRVNY